MPWLEGRSLLPRLDQKRALTTLTSVSPAANRRAFQFRVQRLGCVASCTANGASRWIREGSLRVFARSMTPSKYGEDRVGGFAHIQIARHITEALGFAQGLANGFGKLAERFVCPFRKSRLRSADLRGEVPKWTAEHVAAAGLVRRLQATGCFEQPLDPFQRRQNRYRTRRRRDAALQADPADRERPASNRASTRRNDRSCLSSRRPPCTRRPRRPPDTRADARDWPWRPRAVLRRRSCVPSLQRLSQQNR